MIVGGSTLEETILFVSKPRKRNKFAVTVAKKDIANGRKMEEELENTVEGTCVSEVRKTLHSTDCTMRELDKGNEFDYDNRWGDDRKSPEWAPPVVDTEEGGGDLDSKRITTSHRSGGIGSSMIPQYRYTINSTYK